MEILMNDDRSPDDDDERTPLTHTVVPAGDGDRRNI
jgi:hypothetical protein